MDEVSHSADDQTSGEQISPLDNGIGQLFGHRLSILFRDNLRNYLNLR